jgi:hypothetical protein
MPGTTPSIIKTTRPKAIKKTLHRKKAEKGNLHKIEKAILRLKRKGITLDYMLK